VVKNLAAIAGKFCKRIIHVSLRRCNMVLLKVMKNKENKSKSHKRSGKIKIRKKAMYSTNIGKYTTNITHNIRYNMEKKYGWVSSIYNVHTSKCNNGYVCKKPVWRAGKLRVYKQYGKCTVSIRKQKATGKTLVSCARIKRAIKCKYNTKHTCETEYTVANKCKVVYSRLSKIYVINVINCKYNTYHNRVTEYTGANKCKMVYSRLSKIYVKKDRRSVRCEIIYKKKCILMVTIRRTYRAVYETRWVKSVRVSNVKIYFSVFLIMDPRIAEELDKDMDTDTPKMSVTHGKNCSRVFSGELTEHPGANHMSSIHIRLSDTLSVSRFICCRPCFNPCDVLSIKNVTNYSKPSPLLRLVDNIIMFVNLSIYLYICICAYQYGVICTVNVPQHKLSKTVSQKTYVNSTTPRLYKVPNVHSTSIYNADGDRSHTCRVLPIILRQTRKGTNHTFSKSSSRYGELHVESMFQSYKRKHT
jgi:hypothetical protein